MGTENKLRKSECCYLCKKSWRGTHRPIESRDYSYVFCDEKGEEVSRFFVCDSFEEDDDY